VDEDRRRLLAVVGALVVLVLVVIGWWAMRSARAPHLVGVRVVTRAVGETVASDGVRLVPPGTAVDAAAVVTYRRGDGPERHICAFDDVEIGGTRVEVEPLATWPTSGGTLRAHWYTVEPGVFGAEGVDAANAPAALVYRDFVAAEMGRGMVARVTLEAHDDDALSRPKAGNGLGGGPVRLKVRVGAYLRPDDLLPQQAISSPGAEQVFNGGVPGVVFGVSFPVGVAPEVARYLRVGCFTFVNSVWPDGGAGWRLPLPPGEMVRRGFVVTPRALAAAAAGDVLGEPWGAPVALVQRGARWVAATSGQPLRWGVDVGAGDAVEAGERWAVVLTDDGDGVLSLGDAVLAAWGEPASREPLAVAIPPDVEHAELRRRL
jgi:hypothetical protein